MPPRLRALWETGHRHRDASENWVHCRQWSSSRIHNYFFIRAAVCMQKYNYIYENWISGRLYTVNTDPTMAAATKGEYVCRWILGRRWWTVYDLPDASEWHPPVQRRQVGRAPILRLGHPEVAANVLTSIDPVLVYTIIFSFNTLHEKLNVYIRTGLCTLSPLIQFSHIHN